MTLCHLLHHNRLLLLTVLSVIWVGWLLTWLVGRSCFVVFCFVLFVRFCFFVLFCFFVCFFFYLEGRWLVRWFNFFPGKCNNNNNDDDHHHHHHDDHHHHRTERRNPRFVYNLLSAPRSVSNTSAQVARAQSCANHVPHIGHSSRAACRVPRGTKVQLGC